MTKPLPSLALDMSQDGITLHQLAFDGHWHEHARVALNDPALRERLSNMRSIATKLEGRRFKTRIWLPDEQILRATFSLMGTDDGARLSKARAEIAAKFGGKPRDYMVQLGKRAEGGAYTVAAVRLRTMVEARTFAKSHGFRARGYSTQSNIEGFAQPPNFTMPADKVKVVGLGLLASTAAATVLGGGYLFITLDPLNLWEIPPKAADFAPFQQPNPGIDRSNSPFASISPTPAPVFPQFAAMTTASASATQPYLPPRQLTAEALEQIPSPTAPAAETTPEFLHLASAVNVNWPATLAALPAASAPDALPSIGLFSLQDRVAALVTPEADTPPPTPSAMASFSAPPRPLTVANTAFYLEPLPAMATRLSPEALAAFSSRSGLSIAQLSQLARPLLLAESKVVSVKSGQPPILPRLRSGRAIPVQVAPPPELQVLDVQVSEAQVVEAIPQTGPAPLFKVISGAPDIVPPLRPAPPVIIPPEDRLPFTLVNGTPDIRPLSRPAPEAVTPPEENTTTPEASVEPPVVDETTIVANTAESALETESASLSAAVDAAVAAAAPAAPDTLFALLEGQPSLLPRLRSGAEIPPLVLPVSAVDPATAEANALRPRRRPQAIATLPAPIDPMISSAAPITAFRALHRTESFAANVARIIEITTSRPRATAPPVPSDPQTVNLPTSASVARAATIENAINLRKTNLLGIFGTADNRTALIRLSGGRNIRVQLGQSFSGWTVVAISTDSVRIRKRNREEILQMPAE